MTAKEAANPKSGNQGRVYRDGDVVGWDTHPGAGNVSSDDSRDQRAGHAPAAA